MKVRSKILSLLKTPLTPSDIKEQLPEISSTGTIIYHLKILEKEGLVTHEKEEHIRGQPTYYYLSKLKNLGLSNWYEIREHQKNRKEKDLLLSLSKIKDKGFISDYEYSKIITPSANPFFEGLVDTYFKINHKGEKFLEEHSKDKQS